MSLLKFQTEFNTMFPNMPVEYSEFIKNYIEQEQKAYESNKSNGKLTFGKFKGYSVKELSLTIKGKEYLQWLMSQTFFTDDKFPDLFKELNDLKIKKKKTKLASLE
jgi:hypothetical protein